jgi:inner membrane protein
LLEKMRGNTHVMIALGSASLVGNVLEIPFKEIPWLLILFCSLLPDIDEPSSNASRPGTLLLPFAPRNIQTIIDGIALLLLFPLRIFSKHRGTTHAPLLVFILGGLLFVYSETYSLWFILAYGSHVFADYLTKMGVPILWPFNNKNYSLKICSTGSIVEWVIFFLFGFLFCFFCYQAFLQTTL